MQPDVFAPPSDVIGSSWQGSPAASGFSVPRASATLAPGADVAPEDVSAASPHGGGSHHHGASANGHGNGNGHHAHHTTMMNGWTPSMAAGAGAATRGAGLAMAPSRPAGGFYLRVGKRALDVVGAAVALVLHAPFLLLAAIAIKLESRGPVFYRSTRIGKDGRPFTFLKMRSMVDGADRTRHHVVHLNEADGPVFKIANDPRVTRVGRFLRITSIDEIPQFINVLRGEMSLVGPRPPLPAEVAQYEPWQLHRLDVLPGITCLWQISGRSRIGFQEWMRLDLEYIRHRSFRLDVKILLRTIPAVLSRDGAY